MLCHSPYGHQERMSGGANLLYIFYLDSTCQIKASVLLPRPYKAQAGGLTLHYLTCSQPFLTEKAYILTPRLRPTASPSSLSLLPGIVKVSSPGLHSIHPLDHKPQSLSDCVPPGIFLFYLHLVLVLCFLSVWIALCSSLLLETFLILLN